MGTPHENIPTSNGKAGSGDEGAGAIDGNEGCASIVSRQRSEWPPVDMDAWTRLFR